MFQRWWSPRRWVRTLPPSTGTSPVVPATSWGDQHQISLWVLREGWQRRVWSLEVTRQSRTRHIPRAGVAETCEEHKAFVARGSSTGAEGSNLFSPLGFLQHLYSCQQIAQQLAGAAQGPGADPEKARELPPPGQEPAGSLESRQHTYGLQGLAFSQQKQVRHLYTHSVKVQVNKRACSPSLKEGLVLGQWCSPQAGQSSSGGCPENATSDAV